MRWIVNAVIAAAIVSTSVLYAQDGAKPIAGSATPPADAAGGAAQTNRKDPEPMVTNVRVAAKASKKFLEEPGTNVVQLGEDIVVRVTQWPTLRAVARAAQKPVTLYINGRDSKLEAIAIGGDKDADLTFRLMRNEKNKDLWRDILRDPTHGDKKLYLSVGPSEREPLPVTATAPNDSVMLDKITLAGIGIFWLVVMTVVLGGLLFFCVTSDMLRSGPKKNGVSEPFSLGRTQMAWWFVLLILAYILIWTFTGERDTIPVTLLALLGISAATAMGAAVIDTTKEQRNAAATQDLQDQKKKLDSTVPAGDPARPAVDQRIADINATMIIRNQPKKKLRFIMDLLTDENGQIALHRYQIVGWTIVLGLIFIASVIRDLSMPELSGTLLALMGISSGTYLGFKLPS